VFIGTFVSAGSGGLSNPQFLAFRADGLYVSSQNNGAVYRYNVTTGAYVSTVVPSSTTHDAGGMAWDASGNLYVMTGFTNMQDAIRRYGVASQEAFTVSLDYASANPINVSYSTADGSAKAGTNYTAVTGTVVFAPGETSKTILIQTIDDLNVDPTLTFTVNLSNPTGGANIARGQGTGTILDGDATKFYVADAASRDRLYRYGVAGNALANTALGSGDTAPMGVVANAAGTTEWVVDANKNVYVHSSAGSLLGSWSAGGLSSSATLTGIATNGTDLWLVDSSADKVYKYPGAASLRSGSQTAASSFSLSVHGHSGNGNPQDMVTDGTSFWVVDGTSHMVFKYTLSGSLLGSWTIDPANAHPTGITINPSNVSDIWIVDSGTDKVYQYVGAAGRTSGSQNAAATFTLAPGDTNPQGIADPPPDMLFMPAAPPPVMSEQSVAAFSAVLSLGPSVGPGVPSLAARDAAFALPVRELLPRLGAPAADLLAVAALAPRLDGSTPVGDRAGTFGGTSVAPTPVVSVPPLDPANNRGVRSDRSAPSARDSSGGDDGGVASGSDIVFATPLFDAAAEE
jgi:hypothetical protein